MKTFDVQYIITCYEGENIDEKLRWICLEQSVELPEEVVATPILEKVVGQVKQVQKLSGDKYKATLAWPVQNIGNDRTQFLNILYGNISLKRGIKVLSVDWNSLNGLCSGPAFGIAGIRQKMNITDRAMVCGVLKPMGLSAGELAAFSREYALGGIDMIKDDHGLANQTYAPFKERVRDITKALQKVRIETGHHTHYFPNITVSGSKLIQNYKFAAELGADGVMVLPELCGYEAMLELAESNIDLPIIAHPAFSGTFVTDPDHGFTPAFLYGELYRAFGADFTIYPNTGGRFSFTPEQCHELNAAARKKQDFLKASFPMPGGGMKRDTIPEWINEYGNDTVFLLGASMFQHPEGVKKAAEEVMAVLKKEQS